MWRATGNIQIWNYKWANSITLEPDELCLYTYQKSSVNKFKGIILCLFKVSLLYIDSIN